MNAKFRFQTQQANDALRFQLAKVVSEMTALQQKAVKIFLVGKNYL